MTTAAMRRESYQSKARETFAKAKMFAAIHPVIAFSVLTFLLPMMMLGAVTGSLVLFALPFILL